MLAKNNCKVFIRYQCGIKLNIILFFKRIKRYDTVERYNGNGKNHRCRKEFILVFYLHLPKLNALSTSTFSIADIFFSFYRSMPEKRDSMSEEALLTSDPEGPSPEKPTRKRRRFAESPRVAALRLEILIATEAALKIDGIQPNILFFPSLFSQFKSEHDARAALGSNLSDLKTIQMQGKKMAWATFNSEGDCADQLLNLRLKYPDMKVSLHRRKQQQNQGPANLDRMEKNGLVFDKKVSRVLLRGALGNTLILRNLPVQVECDELKSVLCKVGEECQVSSKPLRIRTALSKGKSGRTFWLVYSSVDACRISFQVLLLKSVSFRCGRAVRLHPMVHDDSTDVDESKRRKRAIAIGNHHNKNAFSSQCNSHPDVDSVALLEHFLRSSQRQFIFMRANDSMED